MFYTGNSTSIRFGVWLFCSLCLGSCSPQEKESDSFSLEGKWFARWSIDSASMGLPPGDLKLEYDMDGLMIFYPDGHAEITAYGHPGCVISADTLSHSLNWNWGGDTLRFTNEGDVQGLDYVLLRRSQDTLHFSLIEDLELRLIRNSP